MEAAKAAGLSRAKLLNEMHEISQEARAAQKYDPAITALEKVGQEAHGMWAKAADNAPTNAIQINVNSPEAEASISRLEDGEP